MSEVTARAAGGEGGGGLGGGGLGGGCDGGGGLGGSGRGGLGGGGEGGSGDAEADWAAAATAVVGLVGAKRQWGWRGRRRRRQRGRRRRRARRWRRRWRQRGRRRRGRRRARRRRRRGRGTRLRCREGVNTHSTGGSASRRRAAPERLVYFPARPTRVKASMSIKPPVGRARAAAGPGDPSREARVAKAAATAWEEKCAADAHFSRGSFSELWRSCEATACEQPVGRRHGRHVRPLRTRVRPEGRL